LFGIFASFSQSVLPHKYNGMEAQSLYEHACHSEATVNLQIFSQSVHFRHMTDETGNCSTMAAQTLLSSRFHTHNDDLVTVSTRFAVAERLARPTALWEDPGSNLSADGRVYRDSRCDSSFGHGLRHLTTVPRSTQPSTLRGTVNEYQLWLSNNDERRWWMWMIAADRQTHGASCLAWSECWRPSGAESAFVRWTGWTLAMALSHNDSTINIVMAIILLLLHGWYLDWTGSAW